MKARNVAIMFGLSMLMLFGGIVSTYASSYVSGSTYQVVRYEDIPNAGRWKFNTSLGSKKVTTSTLATFKKTWAQAMLGNFGTLTTSSKGSVSEEAGLPLNQPTWLSEHGASKGGIYYSAVSSHSYEPANTCDIDIKFSSDTLEFPN